jgi:hypothetical protein
LGFLKALGFGVWGLYFKAQGFGASAQGSDAGVEVIQWDHEKPVAHPMLPWRSQYFADLLALLGLGFRVSFRFGLRVGFNGFKDLGSRRV